MGYKMSLPVGWLQADFCVIWGDSRRRPLDSQKQTFFHDNDGTVRIKFVFSYLFYFLSSSSFFLVGELSATASIPSFDTLRKRNHFGQYGVSLLQECCLLPALQNNYTTRDTPMAY